MDNSPLVSIIVLNFNGKEYLKDCFESLERLRYPKDRYEVILGDNASTDDSVEYIQKNFTRVRIVQFDQNYGFCKSNNLCAREANGEYLVFLNNDTFVEEDWLANFVQGVLSESDILSCACKILFPHLKDGRVVNAAGGIIFPSGGGLYEGWMDDDSPRYDEQKYTGFGCGAGVLVQKKFFLETGGFDEYYLYSGEEMDLGWRIWLAGSKVLYVPSARMYHYMSRTGSRGKGIRMTPSMEFLVNRNNLYFLLKNFEALTAVKGLLFFIARSFGKIAYALLHGNLRIPLTIGRAYLQILKDLPKILQIRQQVQSQRKRTDKELHEKGILLNLRETFRVSYEGLKNMKKYHAGCRYDTQDAVEIRYNEKGEVTFYKP